MSLTELDAARAGDSEALLSIFERYRGDLYRFVFRMLAQPDQVDDVMQEIWIRGQSGIASFRGRDSNLKSWWFSIASHLCLNWLRQRRCWRVDAQLIGEGELDSDPAQVEQLVAIMGDPSFRYEVVEHVAFCFSCIGRTLEPPLQAAIFLREVFDFSNREAAEILGLSEPVFRHRLALARSQMTKTFDGLCQLINKTGRCYQCVTLREFAPAGRRGKLLTQIQAVPGQSTRSLPEALLDARVDLVKQGNLEAGTTSSIHRFFLASIAQREQAHG
jgi:RNA polymerase sigma-70 factor (ECF subfamily)